MCRPTIPDPSCSIIILYSPKKMGKMETEIDDFQIRILYLFEDNKTIL